MPVGVKYKNSNTGDVVELDQPSARLERLDNWTRLKGDDAKQAEPATQVPGPGEPAVEPGEDAPAILDENTEAPDYSSYGKADLEKMLAARGLEVTEGSGSNGKVVKADLVAALEANDLK